MRINKGWMVVLMLVTLLGDAGCSAISFFPHKAAEKAADRVLDDILPGDATHTDAAKPTEAKKS